MHDTQTPLANAQNKLNFAAEVRKLPLHKTDWKKLKYIYKMQARKWRKVSKRVPM